MTKDEIIKLAREAGFADGVAEIVGLAGFANFANAVAAAEREACAKLCDDLDDDIVDGLAGWQYGEAIRARGTK